MSLNTENPLLIGGMGEFIKASVLGISEVSDFSVEEIEIDKDHIHILLRISPKYAVGQHVRRIKQQTNKLVWQKYPALKRQFWFKKTFWSDGYFVCSVGNASAETIRKYIQEQG
ncbi:IS200/IS605 family transposase [Colwellia sp. BRX10-3]|uniref:IS200/IS605 family transposase n=1 Tax=Colwellia sp. BRX10-3 TaxID=2759844 RepID=UPI001C70E85D|nr:IS200/IS605 family transposase [Colwellia sp. BRX10-3]